jgi:hypothetical protein
LRVLELGIGDILNLDFAWLGVDDAAILAHGWTSSCRGRTITSRARGRSLDTFGPLLVPNCPPLVVVVVKLARRNV